MPGRPRSPRSSARPSTIACSASSTDLAECRKRASRSSELFAGLAAVVIHLADQGLDRVELQLVADEADEGDIEHLAVEIALEVEQENLQQRRAVVEGRAAAEA